MCPKCNVEIQSVNLRAIQINAPVDPPWNGVAYECPHCRCVLGVGIDPVSLKADTVQAVVQEIRRH
jgi:hypothetical protein